MLNKKGQLTIFIIIAIFIVAIVAFYFLVFPKIKFVGEEPTDPVYVYMKGCIEDATIYSAYVFGLQQGYSTVPEKSLNSESAEIAYYYYEGEIIIPDNDFFEKELSKILDEQIIERCTDFLFLEVEGFEVSFKEADSKIKMLENQLEVEVNFPIKVKDEIEEIEFSKFSYNLPIRIGHILDVSRELVEKIKEEPYATDLGFFLKQDVDISIGEPDDCNQIYLILDPESRSINEDEDYVYSFAVKLEDEFCVI